MCTLSTRHAIFVGALTFCLGGSVKAAGNADDEFPLISAEFTEGRQVWLENCKTCHAYGVAGAPIPKVTKQWTHRLLLPLSLLYQHAIEGFYGASDTHMPARGGNPALTDTEVTAAVDYMVALATHYSSSTED